MKKLVFGIGINDADYPVRTIVNGKSTLCPCYRTWHDVCRRVYSKVLHKKRPTYIGATLCSEWISFMEFKSWMETQNWAALQLDKDIILPKNKHYAPEMCCFVTQAINCLLTDAASARGNYPIGVYFRKDSKRFVSQLHKGGKQQIYLGMFDTAEEASEAYNHAKADYVLEIASEQTDKRIVNGLQLHAELYRQGNH